MVTDLSGNNPAGGVAEGPTTEQMAAAGAYRVVPSDSADLSQTSRGIYIGGTGHLVVEMINDPVGTTVLWSALPVGTILPIQVRKILATGTTATLINVLV